MNALRLTNGFSRELFTARTGLALAAIEAPLIEARRRGLVEIDAHTVRPTERGRHFLNDLLTLFLAD